MCKIISETCFGAMDGSIDITPSGGVDPYSYLWTNGSFFATTEDINGLFTGNYLLGVIDVNGCTTDTLIYVQESLGPQTGNIFGLNQVNPSSIYQYSVYENTTSSYEWNIINGNLINGQGTNLVTVQWGISGIGQLNVVETTSTGCIGENVTLNVLIGTNGIQTEGKNKAQIFPNPTSESIYISADNYNGSIYTEVFDLAGNKIQDFNTSFINFKEFSSGIYILKVNYNDKVEEFKLIKK